MCSMIGYSAGMQTIDDAVAARKAALDALRPLSRQGLATLAARSRENSLRRSEMAIILETGMAIGGKPLKDHNEVLDHRDALDHVRALARRNAPIREMDVR